MDPTTTVALVSIATAVVTTTGGIIVAVLTNRQEAENTAEDAVETTLRERLTLRDEQIAALEWKVKNRDARIVQLETELAVLRGRQNIKPGGPDAI